MSKTIVYVGTFDPIHYGHLEVIKRASILYDKVIIGVAKDCGDKQPMLSYEERLKLTEEAVSGLKLENIEVRGYIGTSVEFAKSQGAVGILRAMRTEKDFKDECTFSTITRALSSSTLDVPIILSDAKYCDISSTDTRERMRKNENIQHLVPKKVADYISTLESKQIPDPNNNKSINWKLQAFSNSIRFWQCHKDTIKHVAEGVFIGALLAKCLSK